MKIQLPYGRSVQELDIPDGEKVDIAETSTIQPSESIEEIVDYALDHPIGCRRLEELVRKKKHNNRDFHAAIMIDDKTRACPDDVLAPIFVNRLVEVGVDLERIAIVVATGLHEQPMENEIRELAGGADLPDALKLIGHSATHSDVTLIGRTTGGEGYDVEINTEVMNADLKVSTGFIEPHFFAGFSGGRKSVLPGVASESTILANHSFQNIANPNASTGILTGNPVHEDALQGAKLAELDFILNVVLNKNQETVHAVAGHYDQAFMKGVALDIEVASIPLERRYDAIVTTNSGSPLDLDLYQTVKGIYTASLVAKPGAPIVIASECTSGLGPQMFYSLGEQNPDPQAVLDYIEENGPIVAGWENQVLCDVLVDHEVLIKSSLPDDPIKDMMLTPIEDINAVVRKLIEDMQPGQRLLVLPSGPFALPYVKGSELDFQISEYRD